MFERLSESAFYGVLSYPEVYPKVTSMRIQKNVQTLYLNGIPVPNHVQRKTLADASANAKGSVGPSHVSRLVAHITAVAFP